MAPLGLWRSLQAATVLPGRSVPLAAAPLAAPGHHSPDASAQ
jgi:hypothetical protein